MTRQGWAVLARLGPESEVAKSLPRISPLPGHTPDPVKAQGAWAENAARLTWDASHDPKLAQYQVRWCPGEDYDKKVEEVAGTVAKDGERVFPTTEGLEVPGAAACYKVYVILETGNERGSDAVVVKRPEG